jgi:hypothetical protein
LDDVAGEGQPVDDRGAEAGSVKALVQPLKLSLLAMATPCFAPKTDTVLGRPDPYGGV